MKKSGTKKATKTTVKTSAKAKAAEAAAGAAPAPEATTATEAAPIAAPAATERGGAAKTGAAKASKAKKSEPKAKKTSGLDAAAQVLQEAGQPMNTKTMVEQMLAKGLWKTDGKTPAATIYAAILREIQVKGDKARFKKTERGLFTLNA